MARTGPIQLNVRSAFARRRAHELARLTGMTATQVVEDALRAYVPAVPLAKAGTLVRKGPILVKPAHGAAISANEADAALSATRERDDEN